MDSEYLQNVELDGDPFSYEGSKIGILLIHGFTATTTEVRLLGNRLFQRGYTIHAPLLPGHGTTPQALNKTHYQDWIEEVERSYSFLHDKCTEIFVAGESMGALLSIYLAARHPDIAGIICYSPALIVRYIWVATILQYFMDYIPKTGKGDNLPWKGYKVNPTKASVQLFLLQKFVKHILRDIRQPICVFIGMKDNRVYPGAGECLLQHVNSTQKEIHYQQDSPHCMILADELPEISARTECFIQSVLEERSQS